MAGIFLNCFQSALGIRELLVRLRHETAQIVERSNDDVPVLVDELNSFDVMDTVPNRLLPTRESNTFPRLTDSVAPLGFPLPAIAAFVLDTLGIVGLDRNIDAAGKR